MNTVGLLSVIPFRNSVFFPLSVCRLLKAWEFYRLICGYGKFIFNNF